MNIFPILQEEYFIIDELINYIFEEKIHINNFKSNDFARQIAHFIRLYSYKYSKTEYEKSFEFDDNIKSDIIYFIEINLFGKIMEKYKFIRSYLYFKY